MFTFADPGFVGAAKPVAGGGVAWEGYPTNQTGVLGWWVADTGYSQTADYAEWLNLSGQVTNIDYLNLTNRASGTGKQPAVASSFVNGHDALVFDGTDDYLTATLPLITQPFEVWLCLSKTNYDNPSRTFFSGGPATPNTYFRSQTGPALRFFGGDQTFTTPNGSVITNNFFTFCVSADGASTVIYTNAISLKAGNGGTVGMDQLVIGANYTFAELQKMYLVELIIKTNIATETIRSNINAYLCAKYGITP